MRRTWLYAATTKDEGNAADACLPVGRGVFQQPASEPRLILETTVMSTTLERLKQLFIAKFDFNIEELKPTATLEDLGLDSLDMVEFMFDIENEFKIKIPDQEFKVTTIQEIVDAVDRFISEQRIGVSSDKQS